MSETKSLYYHLYADGKTVKGIAQSTFWDMCKEDFRRSNTRLLVAVYPKDIYFHKGKYGMTVSLEQLRQILGDRIK